MTDETITCDLCGNKADEHDPDADTVSVTDAGVQKCLTENGVFTHDQTDAGDLLADVDDDDLITVTL